MSKKKSSTKPSTRLRVTRAPKPSPVSDTVEMSGGPSDPRPVDHFSHLRKGVR